MKYLIAVLLVAFPLAAHAQTAPRGSDDCERIKDDLAYNNCLARLGPAQGERIPRLNDAGEEVKRTPRSRGRSATRGGRQRAIFDTRGRRGRR